MKTTRRHYVILLLLVFLFAAPGLSAYFLYFHPQWLSSTTTNKGELLNPPVLLTELGKHSKWQLVLWSPGTCEKSCMEQMDKLARVRLALGRRLYEVDLSLLQGADAGPTNAGSATNTLQEPGVSMVRLSNNESVRLSGLYKNPTLFIANPEHYLVLVYPVTAKADDLFHDIKLLLAKGN